MEGKEFLTVAQKLVQMRSEAAIRSSVSRTYYAVFITGRKLLRELGIYLPNDASVHEHVYRLLHNAGLSEIKELAEWLRKLRSKRLQADYDMEIREFQSHLNCELDLVRAKFAITQLENCYQQPLRKQLKEGIQEYERKINRGSIGSA